MLERSGTINPTRQTFRNPNLTMVISQEEIQEHTHLINSLSALDWVPIAREDNNTRLQALETQLQTKKEEFEEFERKTKAEHKDYRKLQSSIRQLLLRVRDGSKQAVDQRISKEYDEYCDAFIQQKEAETEIERLENERSQLEIVRDDLEQKTQTIKDCNLKIETMYKGLFDGYTPEFPEEEIAERHFNDQKVIHDLFQYGLTKCSKELGSLIEAEQAMAHCIDYLREARDCAIKPMKSKNQNFRECLIKNWLTLAATQMNIVKRHLKDVGREIGVDTTVVEREYSDQTDDRGRHVETPLPDFDVKIQQNIDKFEQIKAAVLLQSAQCRQTICQLHVGLDTAAKELHRFRKKLDKVRFEVMLRLTDPAAIHPILHQSAVNADQVGDAELPTYSPIEGYRLNIAKLNDAAATSIGVPTYEDAQLQANSPGGFRFMLEGARNQVPNHAPPEIGPAPGPGGIGGFRGSIIEGEGSLSQLLRSNLSLKIPEPQIHRQSEDPLCPSPTSAGASSSSAGTSETRPLSWLNPYAAHMVRQASQTEEEPAPPGAWTSINPLVGILSGIQTEEPSNRDVHGT